MKRVLVVLVAVVMMFTFTAVNVSASAADLTASQTELAEAYCDFFNDILGDDFLGGLTIAVVDIPLAWFDVVSDIGDVLFIGDDIYYYLVGDDLYVDNDGRGGAGGRVCYNTGLSGGGGASRDDLHITGDVFADVFSEIKDDYSAKNTIDYISWRTDKRFNTLGDYYGRLSFYSEGKFCDRDWTEIYIKPFYFDGTETFLSSYQFHFWHEIRQDEDGNNVIFLVAEGWNDINKSEPRELVFEWNVGNYQFADICFSYSSDNIEILLYSLYSKYLAREHESYIYCNGVRGSGDPVIPLYYSSDLSRTYDMSVRGSSTRFELSVADYDEQYGDNEDVGYFINNKPISLNYDNIDFSKFTADDTVTLSGDTIYDYTITNNTTGDSTTVNNYITNNYTYSETDNGGSEEDSSGSVSGDVNVSGNIDVGGSVDVNVNVNSNGSADGGSMPVDVNLENYLEQTPEQAKPITDFFAIFFDFLPAELLGLICLGVVVAIILRVWGR